MACYRTKFTFFYPLNGRLGGIRSHLDPLKKEKFSFFLRESNHVSSAVKDYNPVTALSRLIYLTLRRSVSLDSLFYVTVTSKKLTYGAGLFPRITIPTYQFFLSTSVPYSFIYHPEPGKCPTRVNIISILILAWL